MAGKNKTTAAGANGANGPDATGAAGTATERVKRPRTPPAPDETIAWNEPKSRALALTVLQAPGQYSIKQLAAVLARNPLFASDTVLVQKPDIAQVKIRLELGRLNAEIKEMGGEALPVRRTGPSTFDRRAMLQELLGGVTQGAPQAPAAAPAAPVLPGGFAGQGTGLVGGALIPQPG